MPALRIIFALSCLTLTPWAVAQENDSPATNSVQSDSPPLLPGTEVGAGDILYGLGMGGAGGSYPSAMGLPESAIPGKTWVQSSKVIVALSDDGRQVFAYSEQHPRWVSQDLEPMEGVKAVPVVEDIAAVRLGNHCYAYSPTLGTWDHLQLPQGEVAIPMLGNGSVSVHSASRGDFVFQDSWGKWFSADEIKAGKVAEFVKSRQYEALKNQYSGQTVGTIRVIQLQRIDAKAAVQTLRQIFGNSVNPIADERTNSLLLADVAEPVLEQIQELLKLLDAPPPMPVIGGLQPSQSVEELRELSYRLEQMTLELAASARTAEQDSFAARTLAKELRDTVGKTLEVRQRLQRAELSEFTKRLEDATRLIEARERLADKIIDRRVEELLDPSLNWDTPPTKAALPARSASE